MKFRIVWIVNSSTAAAIRARSFASLRPLLDFDVDLRAVADPSIRSLVDGLHGLSGVYPSLEEALFSEVEDGDLFYPIDDFAVTYLPTLPLPTSPMLCRYSHVHFVENGNAVHAHDERPALFSELKSYGPIFKRYAAWGGVVASREVIARLWKGRNDAQFITDVSAAVFCLPSGDGMRFRLCDFQFLTQRDESSRFEGHYSSVEKYSPQPWSRLFNDVREFEFVRKASDLSPSSVAFSYGFPTASEVLAQAAAILGRQRVINAFWNRLSFGRRLVKARARWLPGRPVPTKLSDKPSDIENIPIIINNRNRLTTTAHLAAWLLKNGHKNIVILDNDSTYQPLLDWYTKQRLVRIVFLGQNLGPMAIQFWREFRDISDSPFIYSDSDIVPDGGTAPDLIARLVRALNRYPRAGKAGPGLRIHDLPENIATKKVIAVEKAYWNRPLEAGVYEAPIDTTFALYRGGRFGGWWVPALRLGPPATVRHEPWYSEAATMTEEERYYGQHANESSSWRFV